MRKFLLAAAVLLGLAAPAHAQNTTCATRPVGDSTNACASTKFVQNQVGPFFITCPANQWVNTIGALASVCSQPSFANLSGNIAVGQMASGSGASTSTFWRGDGTWNNPLTVGATIASGTAWGVFFNNNGILGNTAAGTAGAALIGNGSAAPTFQSFLAPLTNAANRSWQSKSQDIISLRDFGNACTGGGDDSTIIQNAVNALSANGGTILLPQNASNCVFGSTITTGGKRNVVFQGQGNIATSTGVSSLVYSGTAARVFDARDSVGWTWNNIVFITTNAAFNGTIIDCGGTNPGTTVSTWCYVTNSAFFPTGGGVATCINVSEAIEFVIRDNNFSGCNIPIRGQQILGQSTVGKIVNNQFVNSTTAHISDCGEAWQITGNAFEQLASGNAGAFTNNSARPCRSLYMAGNWFGDVGNSTGTWINLTATGAVIEGNTMGGGASFLTLNAGGAYNVSGNYFNSAATAIVCASSPSSGNIGRNFYNSVTTQFSGTCNNFAFEALTAPTVNTGFCTSPSISASNLGIGEITFTLTIGTGCVAGTGTLNMPAAPVGWVCTFNDVTTPNTNAPGQTGGANNTVLVQNYTRAGATANFTSSDVIRVACSAY